MLKAIEKIIMTFVYLIVLLGCCLWFYGISSIYSYCYLAGIINDDNFILICFVTSFIVIFSIFLLRDLYRFSKDYRSLFKK